MSTSSNSARAERSTNVRASVHPRGGTWMVIAIIALFGLALCAVIGAAPVAVDPSQAQLIGP